MNPNPEIAELEARIALLESVIDKAVAHAFDSGDEDFGQELVEMSEGE